MYPSEIHFKEYNFFLKRVTYDVGRFPGVKGLVFLYMLDLYHSEEELSVRHFTQGLETWGRAGRDPISLQKYPCQACKESLAFCVP